MKKLIYISIALLLSCGQSNTETDLVSPAQSTFDGFEHFPLAQYYEIKLGDQFAAAEESLLNHDFVQIESNESVHYRRTADSTEVILPNKPVVSSFRVFINSALFLAKKDEFIPFLREKATKNEKNGPYEVLQFSEQDHSFSLSVFDHSAYLRLSFDK